VHEFRIQKFHWTMEGARHRKHVPEVIFISGKIAAADDVPRTLCE